jgi:hypothetical protein
MSFTVDDIELVRRHTNYTEDTIIIDKLTSLNSAIAVIAEYIQGATCKKGTTIEISTAPSNTGSINQEIYRQFRYKMNIHQKK